MVASHVRTPSPRPAGIKIWAVCCRTGYCYLSVVDAGFEGDIKLRQWIKCPLGRTTRMVLYVLLKACEEFQIERKGVHVAMDNYFTSPMLQLCLLTHGIFSVGTVRKNRAGVAGAVAFWEEQGVEAKKRGQMTFARCGELSIVRWIDSVALLLASTAHIYEEHHQAIEYS